MLPIKKYPILIFIVKTVEKIIGRWDFLRKIERRCANMIVRFASGSRFIIKGHLFAIYSVGAGS
jgi:hypothetical protein